jgi:hypothetical protein
MLSHNLKQFSKQIGFGHGPTLTSAQREAIQKASQKILQKLANVTMEQSKVVKNAIQQSDLPQKVMKSMGPLLKSLFR